MGFNPETELTAVVSTLVDKNVLNHSYYISWLGKNKSKEIKNIMLVSFFLDPNGIMIAQPL